MQSVSSHQQEDRGQPVKGWPPVETAVALRCLAARRAEDASGREASHPSVRAGFVGMWLAD